MFRRLFFSYNEIDMKKMEDAGVQGIVAKVG